MTVAGAAAFSIDPWDPGYGIAFGEETDGRALQESSAELDLELELPVARWAPIDPDPAGPEPGTLLFLDGVRRIDARVWMHGGDPQPAAGIAASFAAGLVCCDGAAHIAGVDVRRGLFTAYSGATDIVTRHARYPARVARGGGLDELSLALQQSLSDAEVQLAMAFRAAHPADDDLLIVDGPLRGRTHLPRVVGYIKTHHKAYLASGQAAVVAALRPGQRTPAFAMGTSWRRTSWYLRLPSGGGAALAGAGMPASAGMPTGSGGPASAGVGAGTGVPWSGVVRLECSAELPRPQVTELADLTARLLPRFASTPHKDPRAPQNLVPIGGLERELRRRLGDQQLLYRSLRAAAG